MLLLASAALAVLAPSSCPDSEGSTGNRVWIVDPNGHGDFEEIQPAVTASGDGDTLVIRPSPDTPYYAGFTITDKSLTVIGPEDGPGHVAFALIRGQNASKHVTISNLDFNWEARGALPRNVPALRILNSRGSVRIQNCRIQGYGSMDSFYDNGSTGARVHLSPNVVLQGCSIRGGNSEGIYDKAGVGGNALVITSSRVALYNSSVLGGEGGVFPKGFFHYLGLDGGMAITVAGGELFLSDSVVTGGDAGEGTGGGVGGHGVVVSPTSDAAARNTTLAGGQGLSGDPGMAFTGDLFTSTTGTAALDAPTSIFEGSILELRVDAEPAEEVSIRVSRTSPYSFVSNDAGVLHTGPEIPGGIIQAGEVGQSGEVSVLVGSPHVSAGGSDRFFVQATITDLAGHQRHTEVRTVEWLDAEFTRDFSLPIFVDRSAPPGGDGMSWETAYDDLQEGLTAAADCREGDTAEIWVAGGVYTPDGVGGERDSRFQVLSRTRLLGGFEGRETRADQRRPDLFPTVLSGDLNRDDAFGGGREDNSTVVMRAGWSLTPTDLPVEDVLIDGLTIKGAGTPGTFGQNGGGLTIAGQVTLRNLAIQGNHSRSGGGVHATSGDVQMVNCRVIGNESNIWGGGLRISRFVDSFDLVQCVVAGNEADSGGGVYAGGPLTVRNSTIANNRAERGAGVHISADDAIAISNSILWGNRSEDLTGQEAQVHTSFGDDPTLDHCCVEDLDGSLVGFGNIGREPTFLRRPPLAGVGGLTHFDFRLAAGSAGVDSGSNILAPLDTTDMDGDGDTSEPIPFDASGRLRFTWSGIRSAGSGTLPTIDMGAYEAGPTRTRPALQR